MGEEEREGKKKKDDFSFCRACDVVCDAIHHSCSVHHRGSRLSEILSSTVVESCDAVHS